MKTALTLSIFVAGIIAIAFLPLSVPVITYPESNDSKDVITLGKGEDNVIQSLIENDKISTSGLTFWINSDDPPKGNTPLQIDIFQGDKLVRHTETTIGKIYQGSQTRALKISFLPLYIDTDQDYTVKITAPKTLDTPIQLRVQKQNDKQTPQLAYQVNGLLPTYSVLLSYLLSYDLDGEDIYHYWQRGRQVLNEGNPYECVISENCRDHKNPGHLPLFYYLSADVQAAGALDFPEWIEVWRPIFILAYLSVGYVLFAYFWQKKQYAMALLATGFWLGNRWAFYVLKVGQIDILALLPLVLSVVWWETKQRLSFVLFGISLAIKQVALFMLPLYVLLAVVRKEGNLRQRILAGAEAVGLMGIVPTVVSLPLFIDNPIAMIKGILFAASRSDEANLGAPSLDAIIHMQGIGSMTPFLILVALVYWLTWKKRITLITGGFIIFGIFICFNTVLFNQYFVWILPFIPLMVGQSLQSKK